MSMVAEFFRLLLAVQTIAESSNCVPDVPGGPSACPASAFNAVTAAFATQGYWVQADILWYLNNTGLEVWAILVYLVAAIAGLISMAMGMPPKLYLWFFVGPAVYHWLVQTTVPVLGVRWNVGPDAVADLDRQERAQREVWKLAEAGLSSSNILRGGHGLAASNSPIDDLGGFLRADLGKVEVANAFLWYDVLMTSLVEWFIDWTGVFYLGSAGDSILSDAASALPSDVISTANSLGVLGQGDSDRKDDQHWALSTLKWQYLESITAAHLSNGDLRDAFVNFLGSECGDAFKRGIDQASFVAAATAKGTNVPASIFSAPTSSLSSLTGLPTQGEYQTITQTLSTTTVPTPLSIRNLIFDDGIGSFRRGLPYLATEEFKSKKVFEAIRCDQYLYLLIHGFRWEAGHHYYQLISGLPAGVTPPTLLYTLFYGWSFRDLEDDNFFNTDFLSNIFNPSTSLASYTPDGQAAFLTDLIFIHLLRNEFALAPKPYDARRSAGAEAKEWGEIYARTLGSKSKFGEIYTWAVLLPYVQGVLLYLLAIAYPFVCIFILAPGWHKVLISWMTFWAWVKLWDVGFAVVIVLERSVWAMLGNNSNAIKLFSRVWSMQENAKVKVSCPREFAQFAVDPPYAVCKPGVIPEVLVAGSNSAQDVVSWINSLKLFDKAMTLSSAMDLDRSNGWYIYIMSALYFAVPAVTGQIVLGAKSGAASLATQALSGVASEVGRGVGTAHTSSMVNRATANNASYGQAAYAKAQRQDPNEFGFRALEQGNLGLKNDQLGNAAQTANSGIGQLSKGPALTSQSRGDALSAGMRLLGAVGTLSDSSRKALSEVGGSALKSAEQFLKKSPNAPATGAAANLADNAGALAITAFSQAAAVGEAVGRHAIGEKNRRAQIQYDAQQAQAGISKLSYDGQKAGNQSASNAMMSAGQQRADEARWAAQRDFSNQVAGYLGAQGVKDGAVNPGSKPSDFRGMASNGQLGSAYEQQALWSDPQRGGYFSWMNGLTAEMAARYDANAVLERYAPAAIGAELSAAFGHTNTLWDAAIGTDGGSGALSNAAQQLTAGGPNALDNARLGVFETLNGVTPGYGAEDAKRAKNGPPIALPPAQFLNPFTLPLLPTTVPRAA